MIKTIIWLLLVALLSGYFVTWMVFLHHFNTKFNHCKLAWEEAHRDGDRQAQRVYYDAEMLAHADTGMSMLWPLVIKRWSADYVAEARAQMRPL